MIDSSLLKQKKEDIKDLVIAKEEKRKKKKKRYRGNANYGEGGNVKVSLKEQWF